MEPLISIVEDDESVRAALQRILLSHSFAVTVFSSAEQFLASAQPYPAACLIVDVSMPGISGLRLHRQLIDAGYRIPTILITGRPTPADRDQALGAGVVSYLPKPFSEQALLDDISLALRNAAPQEGQIQRTNGAAGAARPGDAYF
jgi:FixJ family two-component response regulator